MKKIKLTKGKFAIVDDEDYPVLSRFPWFINAQSGHVMTSIYRPMNGGKGNKAVEMTRFLKRPIWQKVLVHKNHDFLDNRKENLKLVNASIVIHSRKKKGKWTSEYKGVHCRKDSPRRKPWQASIMKKGRFYWIGMFATQKEAALAYNEKARELYGEFAYQNKL